uniref:Uncharacterized protein n=1 Tax=Rhizophora mucronata TaxID=61149 RepID=A0A2P2KUW1_RHIMU
MELYFGIEFFF